jgi:TonB-linked SusC/RagA family outer membrane protein
MKQINLSSLIIFVFLLSAFTSFGSEQDTEISLVQVVKTLEKEYNVSITYQETGNVVFTEKETNEIYKHKNILDALKEIVRLKDMDYKQLRSDYFVLIQKPKKEEQPKPKSASGEEPKMRKVNGKIVNDNGESLPGATLHVPGNSQFHAVSDIHGKFEIIVPDTTKFIEINYVGVRPYHLVLTDKVTYDIILTLNSIELGSVIISGVAGETQKEKLTITVEHLDGKVINRVPATSASTALQGKVPGVVVTSSSGEPGVGSNIRMRGVTSMLGDNSPLVIVDGTMIQTSLADFNSDDIESIEVVKGAAASALYGSKAAGGVIVITTKRGRLMEESYQVVLRNEIGITQLAKQIEQSTHHAYQLASDYENYDYTKYENVQYDNEGNVLSGSRVLTDSAYADQPYAYIQNHQEKFFKKGLFYTNYLGIATKTQNSNLFFSFENHSNEGIVFETDGYTRRNFRFNSDTRLTDRIKFSTSNMYITSKSDKPGSDNSFFDLLFINPDVNLEATNADNSPFKIFPDPWSIEENPLYPLHYRERISTKSTFITSFNLKIKLAKVLNFETHYSFEKFDKYYNTYTPKGYLYGGEEFIKGSIYNEQYSSKSQNFQATLNYFQKFNDLVIKSKASYLYEDQGYYDFSITGKDFIVPNIPQLNNTDPTLSTLNSYQGNIRAINVFGIADVDYKSKYLFSGLLRRDGSSLFGDNERWQNYFRLSFAYRISEEIKIKGIDELKVRMAYGTSGLRPGYSWQYETYYFSNGQIYSDQLGNKNLKPSEAREFEVAMDVNFLKKFDFTASYSKTNTLGAFARVPLASHLGYPYQWRNVGDIKSNVIELSLNYRVIEKKNLDWTLHINFDKINQKMDNLTIPPYYTGPHSAYYVNPGESFGIIYGYQWLTSLDQMANQLPTGKTIDNYEINSDGYVIVKGTQGSTKEKAILLDQDNDGTADKVAIGDGNADFHLSLNSTLNYKKFTFYFLLDWKQGGDVYNYTRQYTFRDARAIEFDQSGKTESDKKSVSYYSYFYEKSINSYFVENGSYLKLREFSIFYNYTPKNTKYFKEIKMGVIGRNLLTFSSYSGFDPEVGSSGDLTTFAFDEFGYPNFRTYSASIQFTF